MKVFLPDGKALELNDGATALDAAKAIGERLAKAVLAAKVDDREVDLARPLHEGEHLALITEDSPEGLEVLRHSAAHVMAEAVLDLWPGTEVTIGPVIKDGFYYDFRFKEPISEEDLPRIEENMRRIVKEASPFRREEVSRQDAIRRFKAEGQEFKVEIIEGLDEQISLYHQGGFVDLCRGPHVPHAGRVRAFKLLSLAGAYWRGDSANPQLTRIYGTAFPNQKSLDEFLRRREEAKKRDHREIGKRMGLFSFHEEGPGFPFFHPKGMTLYNTIVEHSRKAHLRRGYREIRTPAILDRTLWERSGHWENYKDNMYFTKIDEREFAVKPMNCPGCTIVYRHDAHSYRDLPLRYFEYGSVHRHELSGVLHGLFRVRSFTQDDSHIYCMPQQITQEVAGVIDFVDETYRAFGFESYHVELSTRPDKSIGAEQDWEVAERSLEQALKEKGIDYKINPGDGAFYGPKIDFHIEDCMGRTWQCGTIQVDFGMPERLDLSYIGADNASHRPVMIHRALLGSLERFMGILIEQYAGSFPLWLAPVQAVVLPISDLQEPYGREVHKELRDAGLRSELDGRSESLGKRIREAEMAKVPYLLVVGEREAKANEVSLRKAGTKGESQTLSLTEARDILASEAATPS